MNERDSIAVLLKELDRPVAPPPDFAEALRERVLLELAPPEGSSLRQGEPQPRPSFLQRHRKPILAVALGLVVTSAAIAAVLLSRPSSASAFEVIVRARRQFTQLPAFRAVIVTQTSGTRIVQRRFYRNQDAWRNEVSSTVGRSGNTQAGDFQVWDGTYLGRYDAASRRFSLAPADQARKYRWDKAITRDIDPRFWSWPGTRQNTRAPADEFFKRSCKVLPNDVVAGRDARHLTCNYGPVGKPGGPNRTVEIWLDARYGFILKLLGPTNGSRLEVHSITIAPKFSAGLFRVKAPRGSKEQWAGYGVVPPAFRGLPSPRVSATIPVGSNPALLAAGAGSVWVSNLGDGSVTRISPSGAGVTIHRLHAYGLTFGAGSPWVATLDGHLERIDPDSNRPIGRPIAVGGGRTPIRLVAYGNGSLWVAGGKQRSIRRGRTIGIYYGSIVRVDPASGRVVADIPIQAELNNEAAIAAENGAAWVASYRNSSLLLFRIDTRTNRVVATLDLGHHSVGGVMTAFGSVWLTTGEPGGPPGELVRVDPHSNRVTAKIRVGVGPDGMAAAAGSIWVTNINDGTLSKVDPSTNRVVGAPLPIGDSPTGVLFAFDGLWVADNRDNAVVRINRADLP